MDDFTKAPTSIGEARSDRSHSAQDWSVRDMLVAVLRRIDQGDLELTHAVLAYGRKRIGDEPGGAGNGPGGYYMAGSGKLCIAEMEAVKYSLLQGYSG